MHTCLDYTVKISGIVALLVILACVQTVQGQTCDECAGEGPNEDVACAYLDKWPCIIGDCKLIDNCWTCVEQPKCQDVHFACAETICVHNPNNPVGSCASLGGCWDFNLCTADSCVDNDCVYEPVNFNNDEHCLDGAGVYQCEWSDDNECTDEVCVGGVLTHPSIDCDDNNACTSDGCDPEMGCTHEYTCDDGDVCTSDSCDPDVGCSHENFCDDDNECTDDLCDVNSEGSPICSHTNNTNSCDDGNYCTINDHCLNGSCQDTDPRVCQDQDNADGNVCNGREVCDEEEDACLRVDVPDCDDEDPCTDDKCDAATGCENGCFDFPSEWKLEKADDRTFVGSLEDDQQPGDMRVVVGYSADFSIDVTRYAGETNTDGTLKHAQQLVDRELAGKFAELEIITFGSSATACDRVFFGGQSVHTLAPDENPTDCLQGSGCSWTTSTFRIPISKVKFPASRGSNGSGPSPKPNFIGIDFATSNPRSCIKVAGAVLRVKLMSPIILIHGNNETGQFFVNNGLAGGLSGVKLLSDHSISLTGGESGAPRRDNAEALSTLLPPGCEQLRRG